MPAPILRQIRSELAGRTHAILLHPDHRWSQRDGAWLPEGPMRDDRKFAINCYWRGHGGFERGGRRWSWRAPACVLRAPGESGAASFAPGAIHESWIVIPGVTADLLIAGGQLDPRRRVVQGEDGAGDDWRRALRALERRLPAGGGVGDWGLALAALQEFCARVWARDASPGGGDPDLLRIRAAVLADPARRWSIAELAARCGCRGEALRQRFHRRHGHGPSAVVVALRMELAADRLRDRLVKQVAHELGYRDHRQFSRHFRRHHGLTPSAYRRLIGL